jgi:ribosomal protein S18 acetylase RimI-like enzyme
MIVSLSREHVSAVARLHCASLRGLLRELGEPAARAYYGAALELKHAVAFVCLEGGAVAGFVAGSIHPDQLKSDVLRTNPARVLAGLLTGSLRRPSSLWWLARSLRGPDAGSYDSRVPELTYLATDEGRRRHGIGRQLVEAFSAALRMRAVAAYELSVDEGNRSASAFYEQLGFRQVGRYQEFGTQHIRYRTELAARPAAQTADA